MFSFVLLLHVVFCIVIIALVLLQQGKGADVGAAFGSGSANSMFGSRGPASFLFKITVGFVVLFFITSAALTYLQARDIRAANMLAAPVLVTAMPSLPASGQNSNTQFVPPAVTIGS